MACQPICQNSHHYQKSDGLRDPNDEVSERHLLFSPDCVAAIALKIPIDSRQDDGGRSKSRNLANVCKEPSLVFLYVVIG